MTKPRTPSAGRSTASLKRRPGPATGHVLVVRRGDQLEVVPIASRDVVVGRGSDCGAVIDDESISRAHARLRFGAEITIEDLGSRNGTFVAGQRLPASRPTEVKLGEPVTLAEIQIFVEQAPRRAEARASSPHDGVVVRDLAMKRLYAVLEVVAASELRIVVLGETGVGKDVFARTIHAKSHRADRPYLALNCGALAESMLESELFGYEKGAFTGALQAKPGLLESADGGTVLLDEVGELSPATQVKLLRVLESGEVLRLGSLTPRRVDVRIVSATNRDLRAMVADGRFRQDLYFRINGTTMKLPPLRERIADIEPLARMFAAAMARQLKRSPPAFEAETIAVLERYPWPGNAREVKNVIERAVVMRDGSLRPGDLELEGLFGDPPPPRATVDPAAQLWNELELIERQRVIDALAAAGGNQSTAAKQLGIARTTLIRRIEQFGLVRPKKR